MKLRTNFNLAQSATVSARRVKRGDLIQPGRSILSTRRSILRKLVKRIAEARRRTDLESKTYSGELFGEGTK